MYTYTYERGVHVLGVSVKHKLSHIVFPISSSHQKAVKLSNIACCVTITQVVGCRALEWHGGCDISHLPVIDTLLLNNTQ